MSQGTLTSKNIIVDTLKAETNLKVNDLIDISNASSNSQDLDIEIKQDINLNVKGDRLQRTKINYKGGPLGGLIIDASNTESANVEIHEHLKDITTLNIKQGDGYENSDYSKNITTITGTNASINVDAVDVSGDNLTSSQLGDATNNTTVVVGETEVLVSHTRDGDTTAITFDVDGITENNIKLNSIPVNDIDTDTSVLTLQDKDKAITELHVKDASNNLLSSINKITGVNSTLTANEVDTFSSTSLISVGGANLATITDSSSNIQLPQKVDTITGGNANLTANSVETFSSSELTKVAEIKGNSLEVPTDTTQISGATGEVNLTEATTVTGDQLTSAGGANLATITDSSSNLTVNQATSVTGDQLTSAGGANLATITSSSSNIQLPENVEIITVNDITRIEANGKVYLIEEDQIGIGLQVSSQVGQDIDGEASYDYSGWSVAMSDDGSRIAIGAYGNNGNGDNAGHVRIYDYNGTSWIQFAQDIDGEAAKDYSGSSVAMSSDGTRIAIGATRNNGNDSYISRRGHVRVYSYSNVQYFPLTN